ncbi:Pycsar system effector family protein [Pontibacter pamirensis]|uniref:Pycsar system effector family protein n=1 Tax=Pontibacter pamirensis TaxID=2562824 RepID=UPI0013896925|nr:Pycsar system effector family protein [Pontibacter pamirensis]
MVDNKILERTHSYVEHQLLAAGETIGFDLKHTKELVAVAEEVGRSSTLQEEEMEILLLAAWLHDISYATSGEPIDGAASLPVTEYLENSGLSHTEIQKVKQCIAATHYPQCPQDTLEEALCDAVASFLAAPDYLTQEEKQAKAKSRKKRDLYEWMNKQVSLFKKHAFFTRYAISAFSDGKEKNLKLLKKKLKELSKDNAELEAVWEENKKLKKDLVKEKEQKVSKGIETMFRTTMASHLQLSVMADGKANLMISINAIVASILISTFVRKFEEVPHLMIPSIMLTLVCLLTIIFAVLSTRPNIKKTTVPEDSRDLLFFGDFVQLSSDTYKNGIRNIMRDHDKLYNSMIDNIYLQGKVLARKYRLLKIAYTIFMVGFAVVLASYAIAWFLFGQ